MEVTNGSQDNRLNSRLGTLIDKQNLLLDRIIDEVRVNPSQQAPNKGKQILRILEEMEFGLGQSTAPWPKRAIPEERSYSPKGYSPGSTMKYQPQQGYSTSFKTNELDGNSESTIGRNRKDPQRIDREKYRDELLSKEFVAAPPTSQLRQAFHPDDLDNSEADQRFERMLKVYHDDQGLQPLNLPRVTLNKPAKPTQGPVYTSNPAPRETRIAEPAVQYNPLPEVNKPKKHMQDQSVQAQSIRLLNEPEKKPKVKKHKVVAEPVPIDFPIDKKPISSSKLLEDDDQRKNDLDDVSVSSTETVFGKDGARRKQKRVKPPPEPVQIEAEIAHSYRPNQHQAIKPNNKDPVSVPKTGTALLDQEDSTQVKPALPHERTLIRPASNHEPKVSISTKENNNPSPTGDQPKYIKVKLPNEQYVYLTRSEHLAFHLALREASAAKEKSGNETKQKREAAVETDIRGDDILDYPEDQTQQHEETELNHQLTQPPSAVEVRRESPRVEVKPHKTHKSLGTEGLYETGLPAIKARNFEHLPNLQRLPQIPKEQKVAAPTIPSLKDKIKGVPSDAGGGLGTLSDVRLSVNETQREQSKPLLPQIKPIEKELPKIEEHVVPLQRAVLPSLTMIGKPQVPPVPIQLPPVPPQPQESPKPTTKSFGGDFNSIAPPPKPTQQSSFGGQTDRVRALSKETQHKPDEKVKLDTATLTEPVIKPLPVLQITTQNSITVPGKESPKKKFKDQGVDAAATKKPNPQVTISPVHSQPRTQPKQLWRVEPQILERKQKTEIGTSTDAPPEEELRRSSVIEREDDPTMFAEEPKDDGLSGYPENPEVQDEPEQPEDEQVEDRYYDL